MALLKELFKYLLFRENKGQYSKFSKAGVVTTGCNLVMRPWKLTECGKRNWLRKSHQLLSKESKFFHQSERNYHGSCFVQNFNKDFG